MKLLIKQLSKPVIARAGVALTGFLTTLGVATETTTVIVTGATAAAFVLIDLSFNLFRK